MWALKRFSHLYLWPMRILLLCIAYTRIVYEWARPNTAQHLDKKFGLSFCVFFHFQFLLQFFNAFSWLTIVAALLAAVHIDQCRITQWLSVLTFHFKFNRSIWMAYNNCRKNRSDFPWPPGASHKIQHLILKWLNGEFSEIVCCLFIAQVSGDCAEVKVERKNNSKCVAFKYSIPPEIKLFE